PYNAERLPDVKVAIEGPLGNARGASDVPRPGGEAPISVSGSTTSGGSSAAAGDGRGVLDGDPSRALTTPRAGRTPAGQDFNVSFRT
ncbi:hypothetical protein, partial [Streptococcus pneumoniae]|uniref:hypothetical protein n=1 Tax=Streptococcus pneumoniae TaxID=1313 RepID=UPI001952A2E9